ncbi:MAG: glycosyltransferase [Ignavibacteriales bacterium]|nr:glycosyltransferase [Ignavibacteriales bacterium]
MKKTIQINPKFDLKFLLKPPINSQFFNINYENFTNCSASFLSRKRNSTVSCFVSCRSTIEFGHKIDLLTFNEGARHYERLLTYRIPNLSILQNIPIGFSIKKIVADFFITWKMFSLLRKKNYDIIHAVEESIFPAAFFNKFYKKILVYDMDSSLADQLIEKYTKLEKISGILNLFEKWADKKATVVIPVCNYLKNKVEHYSPKKKIQLLEDIAFDSDSSKNKHENIRLYFPEKSFNNRIICFGNLEHYQGIGFGYRRVD